MVQTTLKPKAAASKKRSKPESDEENSEDEPSTADDDSLLSNTPPSAKRQKKGPAPKKTGGNPLQPIDNESLGMDGADDLKPKPKAKKAGTATEQYQKVKAMLPFHRDQG